MKKVKAGFLRAAVLGIVILALGVTLPAQAQSAVLKIHLRDSHGQPLAGVQCEVLSYGWGLQMGEAYAVIARGVTNSGGWLAFDAAAWPFSGYRFKFNPTPQMQPKDTFFDLGDQYRGYPGAEVGGQTQTVYFFIASDGLAYNDLSEGNGPPVFQRNPVGGLDKPRVSIMPAEQYIDTMMAQSAEAQVRGVPTPTIPAKPSPFRGVQTALPLSPEVTGGTAARATPRVNIATVNATVSTSAAEVGRNPLVTPVITPATATGISVPANSTGNSSFLYSVLLALVGITALLLYLKFNLAGSSGSRHSVRLRRTAGTPYPATKTTGPDDVATEGIPEAGNRLPKEEE